MGIAQMCLCKIKYQGGALHHLGGMLNSLKKYRVIWGIAAIVSQYRAIWGHYLVTQKGLNLKFKALRALNLRPQISPCTLNLERKTLKKQAKGRGP